MTQRKIVSTIRKFDRFNKEAKLYKIKICSENLIMIINIFLTASFNIILKSST